MGTRVPRLLLGECAVDVSSLTKVMALLDAIFKRNGSADSSFGGEMAGGLPASTKSVQNLIERHVTYARLHPLC